jgi:hypothetical protein
VKKIVVLIALSFIVAAGFASKVQAGGTAGGKGKGGPVAVQGHVTKSGTYVPPHMRSAPDGTTANNWSTLGNVNPYTGKLGTKDGASWQLIKPVGASLNWQPSQVRPVPTGSDTSGLDASVANMPLIPEPRQVSIPANAKLTYMGDSWKCERGFRKQGGSCAAVEIPANAKLTYVGDSWECERGFRKQGGGCAAVELPANAKLTYVGDSWECERGFRKQGASCATVVLPANAKLTYVGDSWECERGFRKQGASCAAVELPANAKLTYVGDAWECERGYRRNVSRCEPVQ